MPSPTLLTEAEFDALPEREGFKIELNEGEVVMTPTGRPLHSLVREHLGFSLTSFTRQHGSGVILWETEFRLLEDIVRIPDLAFLPKERLAALDPHQRMVGAPALAVEVVSPSNSAADLARKVQQYLAAGCSLVWVIYPEAKLAYIYRPSERPEIREAPMPLDAPELFPGWSLSLAELFAAPYPRP